MSQYGSVMSSGINNYRSSSMKNNNDKKDTSKDKSKRMYMERRKGSSKASIVYDPNYRPGHKSSSSSRHHSSHHVSSSGSVAPMPQGYDMPSYQPIGMPAHQSEYSGSQYGYASSQVGGQAPAQSFSRQQFGWNPTGLATGPCDPEPYSARMAYQCWEEEEQYSQLDMQYAPTNMPSVVSGPAMRGGLCPDDSVSQYSGPSGYSKPSGQPEYSGMPRSRDTTRSSGGLQLSWVEAEPGTSKQYLHRGHRHRH